MGGPAEAVAGVKTVRMAGSTTNVRALLLALLAIAAVVGPVTAEEKGAAQVIRGPYLQLGTPTSIVVCWRTDQATPSRVLYGDDPANLTSSEEVGGLRSDHTVALSGLQPNTLYYYAIGTDSLVLAGGDSDHFFLTAPALGMPEPLRIWVLGDSGTADVFAETVRNVYYTHTGTTHTNLWLMLGDNAYPAGTDQEYQAAMFDMYPEMLRKSVVWPTFGNHDGFSASSVTQSGPYYDIFELPKYGEAGGLGSATEAYYSFDWGNIHFIVMNSQDINRLPGSSMMEWLEMDVNDTLQDWIIAFWHHPPYTDGSHNSDTEGAHIDMRTAAVPILEDHGVDLVLGGHSHSYERSYFIDGHYGDSTTFNDSFKVDLGDGREGSDGAYQKPAIGPDPHQGAVYVVNGSGGQATLGPLQHPAMIESFLIQGSMVLDVQGNRLDARFLDMNGDELDSFTIIKGSTATPPVAEFSASPVVGNMPLSVGFTDLTVNVATDWSWDFDDDGNPDSNLRNPVHLFGAPGAYDVRLTASNASGSDDEVKAQLVCVTAGTPGAITGLRFETGVQTFVWDPAPTGSTYDVVKGDLMLLREAGGDYRNTQLGCLEHDAGQNLATDSGLPASRGAYYYLARSLDCDHGTGTYDAATPGQLRVRDIDLQGASAGCGCVPEDDLDGDDYCTAFDNCPALNSQNITDTDGDNIGDVCDTCPLDSLNDSDGDGFCQNVDNCPTVPNEQYDNDNDGAGNPCDPCPYDGLDDADTDGVCADVDNCPTDTNGPQLDSDSDGFGDVCDPCPFDPGNDTDGDGLCGDVDNCPQDADPGQPDQDGDLVGDACDFCPADANNDVDGDFVCGDVDNCPDTVNFDQQDTDGDGRGGACDPNEMYNGDPEPGDCAPLSPGVSEAPAVVGPTLGLEGRQTTRLHWERSYQGHTYNVYRGLWSVSNPWTYGLDCVESETPDAEVFDSAVPGEAQMIYYLIAPRNACGEREPGIDPQGMPVLPLAACTPLGLDSDGDGHKDLVDNCAAAGNPTQDDLDLDFVGDACDNCPADWNPDQADADNDTLGDACDTTP